MSKIDYQALREAAEAIKIAATPQKLLAFRMKVTPQVVLELLDERERNQQYIKSRDQENEDIALTVGKLRVELEGKDSKIANLTAERDALREGEMGDARHSNTRAAADIYFQLVEECEIPAGGSLVEYVDDMREKLEAAEKRIAELETNLAALAVENVGLNKFIKDDCFIYTSDDISPRDANGFKPETPATDAFLADIQAVAFNELRAAFVRHAKVAELDDADTVTPKEVMDALLHCVEQLRAPE